jgi:hypothetical protein
MSSGGGGGFGGGLGQLIGGELGYQDLQQGQSRVDNSMQDFMANTQPYNQFGQSFLGTASNAIGGAEAFANNTQGYNQFMSGYTNTPAAQYQLQQADQAQNNSAAASGGLLSGANERALGTINSGIVAQNANNAYNEYLSGNQQQFGQLESALGNMFSAIGVGQTATGQQGQLSAEQMNASSQISQAQAKASEGKGSGLGSMFGGLFGGSGGGKSGGPFSF